MNQRECKIKFFSIDKLLKISSLYKKSIKKCNCIRKEDLSGNRSVALTVKG